MMSRLHHLHRTGERSIADEDGAIIPIVALLIIMLLGFAAIAVDLGAAWGQRTLNQSAADAGVMGGGIGFIGDPPQTNLEIVAEVEKYVDLNLGYQISAGAGILGGGEWATCIDPEVTSGEFFPLIDGTGSVINPCVSLSTTLSETGERIFRVLLPVQQSSTSFARIIGINEIATRAFAEADLHFSTGGGGSLPFVMPADADEHYCIGDMPPGLAQSPCDGSNTGKSGDIISPWHGSDYPGTAECPTGPKSLNPLDANIALGLDHQVRIAEGNDLDPAWSPADGQDDCDARDSGELPYALKLGQGSDSIQEGFAGLGPFGSAAQIPGRLRQGGGLNGGELPDADGHVSSAPLNSGDNARAVSDNKGDIWLDNVGLWEYLLTGPDAYGVADDWCDGDHYAYTGIGHPDPNLQFPGGQKATAAIAKCLEELAKLSLDDPIDVFDDTEMLTSPRFALVPQLHVNGTQLNGMTPNTFTNIKSFIPVYIQATFWKCNAAGPDCEMRFRSFEDAKADEIAGVDNDPLNDLEFFSPGEGDEASCLVQTNGKCKSNPSAEMDGVTALVLNPKWVPQEIFTGGPASDVPILIQLSG